nr:unnamed protein product [Digitaria exilis]
MCRSSLISLSVRLASMWLSNALPTFLIATSSPVSELTAALQTQEGKSDAHKHNNSQNPGGRGAGGGDAPDNAVGAAADGADGRRVLGGDLEEHVPPAVRRHPLDLRATAAAAAPAAGGIHGFWLSFLAAREGEEEEEEGARVVALGLVLRDQRLVVDGLRDSGGRSFPLFDSGGDWDWGMGMDAERDEEGERRAARGAVTHAVEIGVPHARSLASQGRAEAGQGVAGLSFAGYGNEDAVHPLVSPRGLYKQDMRHYSSSFLCCNSASPSPALRAHHWREQVPPTPLPLRDPARDTGAIRFLGSVFTRLLAQNRCVFIDVRFTVLDTPPPSNNYTARVSFLYDSGARTALRQRISLHRICQSRNTMSSDGIPPAGNGATDASGKGLAPGYISIAFEAKDNLFRGCVLGVIAPHLINPFLKKKTGKEMWEALDAQYGVSDAGSELYLMEQFLDYRMVEDRPVVEQANELHVLAKDLGCCNKENPCVLPDKFVARGIISKLPPSWRDFATSLKHRRQKFTIDGLIGTLDVEEKARAKDTRNKGALVGGSANFVQKNINGRTNNKGKGKKPPQPQNPGKAKQTTGFKKKKGVCYVCGNLRHYSSSFLCCNSASPSPALRAHHQREQVPLTPLPLRDPARDTGAIRFLGSVFTRLLAQNRCVFTGVRFTVLDTPPPSNDYTAPRLLPVRLRRTDCTASTDLPASNLYDNFEQGQSRNTMSSNGIPPAGNGATDASGKAFPSEKGFVSSLGDGTAATTLGRLAGKLAHTFPPHRIFLCRIAASAHAATSISIPIPQTYTDRPISADRDALVLVSQAWPVETPPGGAKICNEDGGVGIHSDSKESICARECRKGRGRLRVNAEGILYVLDSEDANSDMEVDADGVRVATEDAATFNGVDLSMDLAPEVAARVKKVLANIDPFDHETDGLRAGGVLQETAAALAPVNTSLSSKGDGCHLASLPKLQPAWRIASRSDPRAAWLLEGRHRKVRGSGILECRGQIIETPGKDKGRRSRHDHISSRFATQNVNPLESWPKNTTEGGTAGRREFACAAVWLARLRGIRSYGHGLPPLSRHAGTDTLHLPVSFHDHGAARRHVLQRKGQK